MAEIHTYTWSKSKLQMSRATRFGSEPRPDLDIVIDLARNQIRQQGSLTVLSSADNYIFLEFMKNIQATDDLMNALFANTYYTTTFLSDSLGAFVVPNAPELSSYLYIFSSFVLPYENLYAEIHTKPKYKTRLLDVYDRQNSPTVRQIKEIVRTLLVVPGVPITPLLYIVVILMLKKME